MTLHVPVLGDKNDHNRVEPLGGAVAQEQLGLGQVEAVDKLPRRVAEVVEGLVTSGMADDEAVVG